MRAAWVRLTGTVLVVAGGLLFAWSGQAPPPGTPGRVASLSQDGELAPEDAWLVGEGIVFVGSDNGTGSRLALLGPCHARFAPCDLAVRVASGAEDAPPGEHVYLRRVGEEPITVEPVDPPIGSEGGRVTRVLSGTFEEADPGPRLLVLGAGVALPALGLALLPSWRRGERAAVLLGLGAGIAAGRGAATLGTPGIVVAMVVALAWAVAVMWLAWVGWRERRVDPAGAGVALGAAACLLITIRLAPYFPVAFIA